MIATDSEIVLQIKKELRKIANKKKAAELQRFFKTGMGEYGEGDLFLGITVPITRKFSKKYYKDLRLQDVTQLLKSPYHEERLLALFILVLQFSKAQTLVEPKKEQVLQEKIFKLYLRSIKYINNWDLVDSSAEHIVGAYTFGKDTDPIYNLVKSKNFWKRRIAIMSTFHYIKRGKYSDTLKITKRLLDDKEDLIHKACGWMLREVGNRKIETEVNFLKKHYKQMPRTMLRYAIEKFPETKRKSYLKGEV